MSNNRVQKISVTERALPGIGNLAKGLSFHNDLADATGTGLSSSKHDVNNKEVKTKVLKSTGNTKLGGSSKKVGFFGSAGVVKPTVPKVALTATAITADAGALTGPGAAGQVTATVFSTAVGAALTATDTELAKLQAKLDEIIIALNDQGLL